MDLPRLYAMAIQAVEQRSLVTLSDVTVKVVLDRVLHQNKEQFSILNEIPIEADGFGFEKFLVNSKENYLEKTQALRALLIDLLSVLGNITADILTPHLHKVLMTVNHLSELIEPQSQKKLQVLNLAKKNRESN